MKKLLNISVIAALAVLPVAANAAAVAGEPAHADPATVATANPGYALVESDGSDSGLATAGYVKGAYNAAIKAINKVSETAGNAANQDLTNLSATGKANVSAQGTVDTSGSTNYGVGTVGAAINAIKTTADGAVQNVSEGSTNGTVSVDGTDVAVHGLGSAAYSDTTAFDAAGAATDVQTAIEGKLDDGATGYDINAKTLKVQGQDVLTNADLADYATKDGVLATIGDTTVTSTFSNGNVTGSATGDVSSSFSNGGVTLPIVSTWGATSSTDTAYANSVTGTVTSTFSNGSVTGSATGTVSSTVSAPANYNPGA